MINVLYEAHYRFNEVLLILFVMLLVIPFIPKKPGMSRTDVRIQRTIQVIGMIMVGFGFFAFLSNDIDMYNTTVKAYRNGDYEIVEGYVENFVPMPESGHAQESFDINGVHFEYSENSYSSAYSNTKPHGGVIRNGKYLKIGYIYDSSYGNLIVYIEENTSLSKTT